MVSWARVPLPMGLRCPLSAIASTTAAPTRLFTEFSTLRRKHCRFPHDVERFKVRIGVVDRKQVSTSQTHAGAWEDPDDGSGSEYDDDGEKMDEYDLDFESDWEEEKDASTTATGVNKLTARKYEADLVKEVEELLGPEEREILEQNCAPNLGKISTAKWRPVHSLTLSGQIHSMDKLLANGLDIDNVDKDGLTALHRAIIGKKEAVISHLLRKGASPHVRDQDGATPLHYAVQVGAMQTVKLLIKYNVDVNVSDNDGKTPLDLSFCYGKDFKSYELAKLLKLVPANRDL